DASRSYGASRQSNCTLMDRRDSASAGPPEKRPPQRRVGGVDSLVTWCSFGRSALQTFVSCCCDAGRQTPQLDETFCQRLVEGVVRVIGREVVVVERRRAAAAGDNGATAVQRHADLAGHMLRARLDELAESPLERRVPQAVVDQLAPALLDAALEPRQAALYGAVLEP